MLSRRHIIQLLGAFIAVKHCKLSQKYWGRPSRELRREPGGRASSEHLTQGVLSVPRPPENAQVVSNSLAGYLTLYRVH